MKAYKGFNQNMTCRDFQYEKGNTYETDKAAITVKDGQINFHVEITDGSGLKLEKGDEQ